MKMDFSNTRQLVVAWFVFAVTALGLSTLFAFLLIASRTPGIQALFGNHNFFDNSLVLHVNLSVLVWVLAAGSALHTMFTPARLLRVGWFALVLAALGALFMALGPFASSVQAFKSNYVPILHSWPFLFGLVLFGFAAGLMSARTIYLLRPWQETLAPASLAAYGAAWAVLLALIGALWVYVLIPQSTPSVEYFEQLFWGAGHVLQFANMLFMLSVWLWLAQEWELVGESSKAWTRLVWCLGLLPLLFIPLLFLMYQPATSEFRNGFTELMRWGSWLAAFPLGVVICWRARKHKDILPAEHVGLCLSIILFVLGILIGALITADNVMVPAHYHGTVGAVTLALMVVSVYQLPRLGFSTISETLLRWQLRLYGYGTLIMALGLSVSGWLGVARKSPGQLPAVADSSAHVVAMSFAGLGGAMAVLGSALFVFGIVKSFTDNKVAVAKRNNHVFAGVAVVCLVIQVLAVMGSFKQAQNQPAPPADPRTNPDGHMAQMAKQEIDKHFQRAVAMLHAKQYEYAITALQQVLQLRPDMPEAHVNMGYALLGLRDYKQAVLAFDRATTLRPGQFNAYYGMAEALYEQGDIEGALGAMRSYVHLAPKDDPYLKRANSAIWEWEATVKLRKQ